MPAPTPVPTPVLGRVLGRVPADGCLRSRKLFNCDCVGRLPAEGRVPVDGRVPVEGRLPMEGRVLDGADGREPTEGVDGRDTLGRLGEGDGRETLGRLGDGRETLGRLIDGDRLTDGRDTPPPPREDPPPPRPRAVNSPTGQRHATPRHRIDKAILFDLFMFAPSISLTERSLTMFARLLDESVWVEHDYCTA